MINRSNTITSKIPSHIRETHPNFVEFLKSYNEWLEQPGNPYYQVKHHMDFSSFEKSLDSYTDFMMEEYVTNIPKDIAADKKQLIEWSKKFNLSRGSHESLKFLFKVMFNEDTTEIYLPKENILRSSDGVWIQDQSIMITNNPGNTEDLLYRTITQTREIAPNIFETATAVIENTLVRYSGGFNVLELTLIDIEGEFKEGFPIVAGDETTILWPIKSVTEFVIQDGGTNYFNNEIVIFDAFDQRNISNLRVSQDGIIDTRISTLFPENEIEVKVNGNTVTGYEYDGQFLTGDMFSLGDDVEFIIPQVYVGTMKIGQVDFQGSVQSLVVEQPPIGLMPDQITLSYDEETSVGLGSGLQASALVGIIRKVPGYYQGTKGQLSSNMYVLDSFYYQEYSYVIKTQQDILKYTDVVKQVLHPAGFKFFGNVQVISTINSVIDIYESDVNVQNLGKIDIPWYPAAPNFAWVDRAGWMSDRVYKGNEWDQLFVDGEVGYDLRDYSLERTFDLAGDPIVVDKKGWMTYTPLTDFDIRQHQDFFEEDVFDGLYMEAGYVTPADYDETTFINTYINTYMVVEYTDEGYAE